MTFGSAADEMLAGEATPDAHHDLELRFLSLEYAKKYAKKPAQVRSTGLLHGSDTGT